MCQRRHGADNVIQRPMSTESRDLLLVMDRQSDISQMCNTSFCTLALRMSYPRRYLYD